MKKKNARPTKGQPSANEHRHSNVHEQLELLPLPEFRPTYPAPGTLAAEALARMLSGERLTQPAFGTHRWRLAAYVHELKYLGWPVKATPVNYPGHTRPIAQYWLDSTAIMAARAMHKEKA